MPGSYRRAWRQVAATFIGLAVVAAQLPSPRATLATVLGSRPAAGGSGVADAAMLAVAAVVVWLLLGWVVVVSTAAAAGRLPGAVGSAARATLLAVAPVAVRNVLLTVVGASVVTSLAGCTTVGAGPAVDALGQPAVAPVTSASAAPAAAMPPAAAMTPALASGTASQLNAERLIGIATLRISDRIAVEGSTIRSAAAGPSQTSPTVPSLDWPATVAAARAPAGGSPGASAAAAPGGHRSPTPPVSVDWPGPTAGGAHQVDTSVVVLRGDSLWSIAARSLPAGADDATIDRTWRAWYSANTSVIGSDPDLLLPGQILQPPTPGTVAP